MQRYMVMICLRIDLIGMEMNNVRIVKFLTKWEKWFFKWKSGKKNRKPT